LHPRVVAVTTPEVQRNPPIITRTQPFRTGQRGRSLSMLFPNTRVRKHKMMQVIPPHPTATKARGWISGSPCLTDTANMALVMVEMSVDMIDNVPRKCLTLVFGIMNCRGLYKQSLDDGRTI